MASCITVLLLFAPLVPVVAIPLANAAAAPVEGGETQPLPISSSGCTLLAPYALITASAARITASHVNGFVAVGGPASDLMLPGGDDLAAVATVAARAFSEELPARCTTTVSHGRTGGVVITFTARGTTNDVQCVVGAADLEQARTVRLVGTAPAALFVVL